MRGRLIDEVLDKLLAIARSPEFGPGDALPRERVLAEQFGVSRSTIRQAFRVLEDRGVVTTRLGSGRYLREVDAERTRGARNLELASIVDIFETRVILESSGAALACERRSTAEAADVRSRAATLEGWADNAAFHRAVAAAAHNFMLERLVAEQIELARQLHQREHYDADAIAAMREEHVAIADAVLARDADRARTLMGSHLRASARAVLEAAGDH
jgi:GntR family transcriptional repressor for pyruvate dehydrogenase complex